MDILDTINKVDQSLFLWMNGIHSTVTDSFWLFMSSYWAWLFLFIPAAFFVFRTQKLKGFYFLLMVVFLFLLADQGSNIAKTFFERPRPCRAHDLSGLVHFIAKGCSAYGFWSGHAANSFAQVTFLLLSGVIFSGKFQKGIYAYFILWAFIVALSRVMVGVHYPGDILVGALYGIFCGAFVHGMNQKLKSKLSR